MKKYNYKLLSISVSLIFGLSTSSCEDITSENNTITASFNTFEELVQGRLPSIYASLRSPALYRQSGLLGTWADVGIDTHTNVSFPPVYVPFYTYNYNAGSLFVGQTWTEFYIAIKQINTFLGQVDTFEASAKEKNPVIAEARFLRGLLYFDMVKIWGDIPLVISEDITLAQIKSDSNLTNSRAEEVYLQIIKDLKFAKNNGVSRAELTPDIASSEAAQALLGKVYLQMTTTKEYGGIEGGVDEDGSAVARIERFRQAEVELSGVIESGIFKLESNYSSVFSNERSDELLFSVGYDGPNLGVGGDFGDFLGEGDGQTGGSFGTYRISTDFALEYLRGDVLILDRQDLSDENSLPPYNDVFFDTQNFKPIVRLLGAENFVSDSRFDHNVGRVKPEVIAKRLRGEVTNTPLEIFNQTSGLGFNNWSPLKYIKPVPNPNPRGQGSIDFPYLRYADVLLMEAEALTALGDLNGAKELVNKVVSRSLKGFVLKEIPANDLRFPTASSEGTPKADIEGVVDANLVPVVREDFLITEDLSADEMLDRIVEERGKELAFEGKRKDDLIRTGKLAEIIDDFHLQTSVDQNLQNYIAVKAAFNLTLHTHWPIPQTQLVLNPNLKQNCLYGSGGRGGCF